MQTRFSPAQLADPATAAAAGAIRSCVHCGFCTATCPTYVLLGNELDSPRGRIYLIKEMLEKSAKPSPQVAKHLDRCLSCLSCETHCPSGVSYRRVIDKGRVYLEEHYRRPWNERVLRGLIAKILPHRRRFRLALKLAVLGQPFAALFERAPRLRPLAALLRLGRAARMQRDGAAQPRGWRTTPQMGAASKPDAASSVSATASAGRAQLRVGLVLGCVEPVLNPEIQAAASRLLIRAGCEVVRAPHDGCCGALSQHMGREAEALARARAQVDLWHREIESSGLDAIVLTTSGCGPVVRDYGHLLRDEPAYAAKAARVAALACDLTELIDRVGLPAAVPLPPTIVGYHPACSLQHGQKVQSLPQRLLGAAGFEVRVPVDSHLCCGSAGVYNVLQPEIAAELGKRKAEALRALGADVIATGNIGCIVQISAAGALRVVHIAELLDWATGGPAPATLAVGAVRP